VLLVTAVTVAKIDPDDAGRLEHASDVTQDVAECLGPLVDCRLKPELLAVAVVAQLV